MDELDLEASRFTHGGAPIRSAQDRADSVTAAKIVEYRTAHGAFPSVNDLDEVPGIGLVAQTARSLLTQPCGLACSMRPETSMVERVCAPLSSAALAALAVF